MAGLDQQWAIQTIDLNLSGHKGIDLNQKDNSNMIDNTKDRLRLYPNLIIDNQYINLMSRWDRSTQILVHMIFKWLDLEG